MFVDDDVYIDFDMRHANQKIFCQNCKRKIKYSEVKKPSFVKIPKDEQ